MAPKNKKIKMAPKFVWKKKIQDNDNKFVTELLQKTVKADIYLDFSKEDLSLSLNRSKQHLEQEHWKWNVNICPKTVKLNKKSNDELEKLIRKIEREREQAKLKNILNKKK